MYKHTLRYKQSLHSRLFCHLIRSMSSLTHSWNVLEIEQTRKQKESATEKKNSSWNRSTHIFNMQCCYYCCCCCCKSENVRERIRFVYMKAMDPFNEERVLLCFRLIFFHILFSLFLSNIHNDVQTRVFLFMYGMFFLGTTNMSLGFMCWTWYQNITIDDGCSIAFLQRKNQLRSENV